MGDATMCDGDGEPFTRPMDQAQSTLSADCVPPYNLDPETTAVRAGYLVSSSQPDWSTVLNMPRNWDHVERLKHRKKKLHDKLSGKHVFTQNSNPLHADSFIEHSEKMVYGSEKSPDIKDVIYPPSGEGDASHAIDVYKDDTDESENVGVDGYDDDEESDDYKPLYIDDTYSTDDNDFQSQHMYDANLQVLKKSAAVEKRSKRKQLNPKMAYKTSALEESFDLCELDASKINESLFGLLDIVEQGNKNNSESLDKKAGEADSFHGECETECQYLITKPAANSSNSQESAESMVQNEEEHASAQPCNKETSPKTVTCDNLPVKLRHKLANSTSMPNKSSMTDLLHKLEHKQPQVKPSMQDQCKPLETRSSKYSTNCDVEIHTGNNSLDDTNAPVDKQDNISSAIGHISGELAQNQCSSQEVNNSCNRLPCESRISDIETDPEQKPAELPREIDYKNIALQKLKAIDRLTNPSLRRKKRGSVDKDLILAGQPETMQEKVSPLFLQRTVSPLKKRAENCAENEQLIAKMRHMLMMKKQKLNCKKALAHGRQMELLELKRMYYLKKYLYMLRSTDNATFEHMLADKRDIPEGMRTIQMAETKRRCLRQNTNSEPTNQGTILADLSATDTQPLCEDQLTHGKLDEKCRVSEITSTDKAVTTDVQSSIKPSVIRICKTSPTQAKTVNKCSKVTSSVSQGQRNHPVLKKLPPQMIPCDSSGQSQPKQVPRCGQSRQLFALINKTWQPIFPKTDGQQFNKTTLAKSGSCITTVVSACTTSGLRSISKPLASVPSQAAATVTASNMSPHTFKNLDKTEGRTVNFWSMNANQSVKETKHCTSNTKSTSPNQHGFLTLDSHTQSVPSQNINIHKMSPSSLLGMNMAKVTKNGVPGPTHLKKNDQSLAARSPTRETPSGTRDRTKICDAEDSPGIEMVNQFLKSGCRQTKSKAKATVCDAVKSAEKYTKTCSNNRGSEISIGKTNVPVIKLSKPVYVCKNTCSRADTERVNQQVYGNMNEQALESLPNKDLHQNKNSHEIDQSQATDSSPTVMKPTFSENLKAPTGSNYDKKCTTTCSKNQSSDISSGKTNVPIIKLSKDFYVCINTLSRVDRERVEQQVYGNMNEQKLESLPNEGLLQNENSHETDQLPVTDSTPTVVKPTFSEDMKSPTGSNSDKTCKRTCSNNQGSEISIGNTNVPVIKLSKSFYDCNNTHSRVDRGRVDQQVCGNMNKQTLEGLHQNENSQETDQPQATDSSPTVMIPTLSEDSKAPTGSNTFCVKSITDNVSDNRASSTSINPGPSDPNKNGEPVDKQGVVQRKRFIKTKFIILKGDICDRWMDVKNKTGYKDMSDPKFIHHLLCLEEMRQQRSQWMSPCCTDNKGQPLSVGVEDNPVQPDAPGDDEDVEVFSQLRPLTEPQSTIVRSSTPPQHPESPTCTSRSTLVEPRTPRETSVHCETQRCAHDDHHQSIVGPTCTSGQPSVSCLQTATRQQQMACDGQHQITAQLPCTSEQQSTSHMQTATKHPQMDKLGQPLDADHDQNIVKADLNNNSQNIAIDLNNNSDTFLNNESGMCLNDNSDNIFNYNLGTYLNNSNSLPTMTMKLESGDNMSSPGGYVDVVRYSPASGFSSPGLSKSTGSSPSLLTSFKEEPEDISDVSEKSINKDFDSPELDPFKGKAIHDQLLTRRNSAKKRPADELLVDLPESKRRRLDCLSANTRKQMKWALSVFKEWLMEQSEVGASLIDKDASWFDKMLAKFYVGARTQEGKKYSADSLQTFRRTLSLYLATCSNQNVVSVNISMDPEYSMSNKVFAQVTGLVKPRAKDLGNLSITDSDFERLYTSGALSDSNPVSLSWKVWFDLAYHLCTVKPPRHFWRSLTRNSLALQSDCNGVYYSFVDREHEPFAQALEKMYATPTDPNRCPVRTLALYISKLDQSCNALFQYPRHKWISHTATWYIASPISRDKLNCMMATISKQASLSQVYNTESIILTAEMHKLEKDKLS